METHIPNNLDAFIFSRRVFLAESGKSFCDLKLFYFFTGKGIASCKVIVKQDSSRIICPVPKNLDTLSVIYIRLKFNNPSNTAT